MTESVDKPKLLGSPEARATRRAQLAESHMRPLAAFVERLRVLHPSFSIPDFDPWDGGTAAEVLFLLEAPGPKAIASGFISRNNPDETAKNFFELNRAAGLDRRRTATWNIVPWYVGSGTKIRAVRSADIAEAIASLRELLTLLPKLGAVVLVGQKAQGAERHVKAVAPNTRIFHSPHPSPMFVNNKPGNRAVIEARLHEVVKFLDQE